MGIIDSEHGERPDGFQERIVYSDTNRVWCMGEHMDHPKVYYTIPEGGEVVCGYCDTIFRMKKDEESFS
tara:strand:+ start:1296 stop:1502 length:207 start_codon:yes stop_codon:yes gene_type:complete